MTYALVIYLLGLAVFGVGYLGSTEREKSAASGPLALLASILWPLSLIAVGAYVIWEVHGERVARAISVDRAQHHRA